MPTTSSVSKQARIAKVERFIRERSAKDLSEAPNAPMERVVRYFRELVDEASNRRVVSLRRLWSEAWHIVIREDVPHGQLGEHLLWQADDDAGPDQG